MLTRCIDSQPEHEIRNENHAEAEEPMICSFLHVSSAPFDLVCFLGCTTCRLLLEVQLCGDVRRHASCLVLLLDGGRYTAERRNVNDGRRGAWRAALSGTRCALC